MEISGKMTDVLEEVSGQGKNGLWKKRGFLIETGDKYPKKIHFSAWGDLSDVVKNTSTGTILNVFFDIESREYQGKWYTEVKAWKIEGGKPGEASSSNSSSNPAASSATSSAVVAPDLSSVEDDGMPF